MSSDSPIIISAGNSNEVSYDLDLKYETSKTRPQVATCKMAQEPIGND